MHYRVAARGGVIRKPKRLNWHEQSSLTLLLLWAGDVLVLYGTPEAIDEAEKILLGG